jgi:hypothetical protein
MKEENEMIKRSLIGVIIITVLIVFYAPLCLAQGQAGSAIDALARSSKLIESDRVLQDFRAGRQTTRVIVALSEPAGFQDRKSFNISAYREKLQRAVKTSLDRTISLLDPAEVRITNRFVYVFGFSAEVTLEGLKVLEQLEEVDSISHDRILKAHLAQGIPLMSAAAPRSMYSGAGMAIAICDTGIDTSHPMMGGGGSPIFNTKVIGGYDTGDDDTDPRPNGEPHGTACAGIAAGDLGAVGDYIGGVAHNAKLYAVKISYGSGGSAYTSDMIEGWEWIITHQYDDPANPIMIISTSFGGGYYTSICDSAVPAMTTVAANAVAAGMTLFVSSGNDGYTAATGWPACISHVNSVGAVYDADVGPKFWAPCSDPVTAADQVTCYSNSASFLTLFAPSNDAYTADIVGSSGYSGGDYISSFGGTSAACPYAAGAAAVLQSAAEAITGAYLSPADVRALLTGTGDLVMDPKVPVVIKPRINLQAAVDQISATDECIGNCQEDETGALNIVETSATSGSDVSVTVEINSAPNMVDTLGFEVVFNPADCLAYTGAYERGDLTTGFDFFDCNLSAPGVVTCGGFTIQGQIPQGASGNVVELTFNVGTPELDEPGEAVRLDLRNLVDDLAAWLQSPGYICGGCGCDVNGDAEVTPQDALCAFQKYLGIDPTACGPAEEICCDVNGDGECTPADAQEIFKEYLGMPSVCSE